MVGAESNGWSALALRAILHRATPETSVASLQTAPDCPRSGAAGRPARVGERVTKARRPEHYDRNVLPNPLH